MQTNSTPLDISGVVTRLLAESEFSHKFTAETTGIPRATLLRRLSGHSPFQTTELAAIAALLGVNVSDIVLAAENVAA